MEKRKIIVAPLNWGLGHATRCIPIIKALLQYDFEPVIASDGVALELLKKEFPYLRAITLPSYNITYPKKAINFKLKLIKDSPHLVSTIKREKKVIHTIIDSEHISGIISDNRFGVRHRSIPSVFITHQLQVLSGNTTWLSSKLHQKIIQKFDECWVPDHKGLNNLSGNLGHPEDFKHLIKYLGPLSRFHKLNLKIKYDLLVVLSGPEPQRTFLEKKLFEELEHYNGKVCFVKGKIKSPQNKTVKNNMIIYNYMTSNELEIAINESAIILSRSGYTSIMDYAKLEKKAFFIPTPGQFEQEYLANKFHNEGLAPYCNQKDFKVEMLSEVNNYKGFTHTNYNINFRKLFNLFQRERKLTSDT